MTKKSKRKMPAVAKAPSLKEVCDIWAHADHWPLVDAVNLALGYAPEIIRTRPLGAAEQRRRDVLIELARNCAGVSLTVIRPDGTNGELRVRPGEFLAWIGARTPITVPEALILALSEAAAKLHRVNPERELGLMQRRRERCRAIAALLWAQNPELTKAEVAAAPEIQTHGCLGGEYAPATLQNWIKEENPKRQGGRPRRPA